MKFIDHNAWLLHNASNTYNRGNYRSQAVVIILIGAVFIVGQSALVGETLRTSIGMIKAFYQVHLFRREFSFTLFTYRRHQ